MKYILVSLLILAGAVASLARADVEVVGLFKNAALLRVDGQQKLVKAGQSWREVKVISADPHGARVEIKGVPQSLKMSQRISTSYVVPTRSEVLIPTNEHRQYITHATINGRSIRVLVDTGANIVAMNIPTARALGLDYKKGVPARVNTAGGVVDAWRVMLDSVDVGGIRIDHVEASVVSGSHPQTVLLGMSYLQHVEMSERDGLLVLARKY